MSENIPLFTAISGAIYHSVLPALTYLYRSTGVRQPNLLQGMKISKKCCGGPYAVKGIAWSKLCLKMHIPSKKSGKS